MNQMTKNKIAKNYIFLGTLLQHQIDKTFTAIYTAPGKVYRGHVKAVHFRFSTLPLADNKQHAELSFIKNGETTTENISIYEIEKIIEVRR